MKRTNSKLVIAPAGKLQSKIVSTVRSLKEIGIYVSLNKNPSKIKEDFKKSGIDLKKLFFIDCVGSEGADRGTVQISPARLDDLGYAIGAFVDEIKEKKFLVIDALSVLLIYNNENEVASFVRDVIEHVSGKDVDVIAFSPETKEEELLNKIFGAFDEVIGK